MKALQISAYRTDPVLRDVDNVSPGSSEVIVDVRAASLNPLDLKLASGAMHDFFPVTFPYTLGTDFAGIISAVGADVAGWSIGDPVIGRLDPSRGGAFAEKVAVDASLLVRAPATVELDVAAGIPTAAATAWQALTEVAKLDAGQTVLIHGGAGGVGSFAIQFAHRLGAQVLATASGTGLGIATRLGADRVIDHTQVAFEGQVSEVDLVLDTIGGENEVRSLEVLKPDGLLVAVPVPPDSARAEARGVRAEFVFHTSDAERLAKVVEHIDDGMQVLVDRTVPLSSAAQALAHFAKGHARGKILLAVD